MSSSPTYYLTKAFCEAEGHLKLKSEQAAIRSCQFELPVSRTSSCQAMHKWNRSLRLVVE
jgi:hypothetical protein